MTVSEAQQEIKDLLEKADLLEKKYPDPESMPNEDREQVRKLLDDVDGLEAKLATLEDADMRRKRILDQRQKLNRPARDSFRPDYGDDAEGKMFSPGTQFLDSLEYRNLKQSGALNSNMSRVEVGVVMAEGTSLLQWARASKALLTGAGTASGHSFVIRDRQPGYLDILQAPLNVIDIIPRTPTTSDTIEYVQESTFTNNAAFVAEATGYTASTLGGTGLKPESALAYTTQQATVRTMAHWIPVTNRMLADAPAIRGTIDGRLLFGLQQKLQSQIVSGDGTGENLTGILNTAGVGVVSKGTDSQIDALFKGRTSVMWTGFGTPSAYVLNPTDWQTIRLARETTNTATPGTYLFGPPSTTGQDSLWGIPVVQDPNITLGTGLIGDFNQGVTLFDREQGAVRVGTVNDQFIRNMQTILAELRVAFVVWRPAVFVKVTGL